MYRINFKGSVKKDLKKIDVFELKRIRVELERMFQQDPSVGTPLKGEFTGCFKLRIGNYRVIYTRTTEGVLTLRIRHRKDVYR